LHQDVALQARQQRHDARDAGRRGCAIEQRIDDLECSVGIA